MATLKFTPPPIRTEMLDPETGQISRLWEGWFNRLNKAIQNLEFFVDGDDQASVLGSLSSAVEKLANEVAASMPTAQPAHHKIESLENQFEGQAQVFNRLEAIERILEQARPGPNLPFYLGEAVTFEQDGTLVFHNDAMPYEDIQVAVSSARYPAANSPTWRTFDYGIAAGVTYPALGFAIDDYIEFFIQTQHSQKLNTVIDNHIHWTIPSDSVDDKVNFQLDVIAAGIGADYAVPAGSPFTSEYTLDGTESGKHKLLEIADIPASNTTISSVYICRLGRIAASSLDYAPEVYITFNDGHYLKDTLGSRLEDSK